MSTNINSKPLSTSRRILAYFPHSQHRPVICEVDINVPMINSIPKPSWNCCKANWTEFTKSVNANDRWIPPKAENYDRFVGVIISWFSYGVGISPLFLLKHFKIKYFH